MFSAGRIKGKRALAC